MIIDPETQEIKLRILWLPRYLENSHVVEALKPFGAVKSISREKWRCPGMEHIETLNREVVLRLADGVTVERVPHLLNVYGCQCLVLVPGRPPLCLRCTRVGHVRRYCRTPRCQKCRRFGHSSADCVTTYATKLQGAVECDNESSRELIMDITEVIDASGEAFEDKLLEAASEPAARDPTSQGELDPQPVTPAFLTTMAVEPPESTPHVAPVATALPTTLAAESPTSTTPVAPVVEVESISRVAGLVPQSTDVAEEVGASPVIASVKAVQTETPVPRPRGNDAVDGKRKPGAVRPKSKPYDKPPPVSKPLEVLPDAGPSPV